MSPQLLDLLKLCLLALLYLFFLRVVWAVWTELRTPAVAAPTSGRVAPKRARAATPRATTRVAPAAGTLRVVEPPHQAGTEYPVSAEMTIGRAPGCTVVVDDTFVSQLHARVFLGPDGPMVEDLGSTNGTMHNGRQLEAPQPLHRGDRIQLGGTILELG